MSVNRAKTKVVLLLCGSFNPITILHLRLFDVARDHLHSLGLHEVVGGILSPVHDAYFRKNLLPGNQRLEMVTMALRDRPDLIADDWELRQPAWSPTRQVLEAARKRLKNGLCDAHCDDGPTQAKHPKSAAQNDPPTQSKWVADIKMNEEYLIKFLCGADLLESFSIPDLWKPKDIEYILDQHGLVVVTREQTNPQKFLYECDIVNRFKMKIDIVINWMGSDISSTKTRRAIARNESVKYIIPDSVIDYIRKNKLYK